MSSVPRPDVGDAVDFASVPTTSDTGNTTDVPVISVPSFSVPCIISEGSSAVPATSDIPSQLPPPSSASSHSSLPTNTSATNPNLHYIGSMSQECPHCSALRFPNETLNCCHGGKVTLPTDEYPESLRPLFENREFLDNIRSLHLLH